MFAVAAGTVVELLNRVEPLVDIEVEVVEVVDFAVAVVDVVIQKLPLMKIEGVH